MILRFLPRRIARLAAAVAATSAAALLTPARAAAQSTTFYLDRLQIAGAPDDGLAVWRPAFGPTRFYGQLAAGFSRNPLRAEHLAGSAEQAAALRGSPVTSQLTAYLTAGVELEERGAVQFSFPLTVSQTGWPTDHPSAGFTQAVSLAQTAPADLRLDARALLARSPSGLLTLGARAAVFLPAGDARSFTGEGAAWGNLALSAELDLRSLFVTVNAGASVRPRTSLGHLSSGSELTGGLGAYLPLMNDRLRLGAELFGSLSLVAGAGSPPIEGSAQARLFFNDRHTGWAGAAAGTRVTDGMAPDLRAVLLLGGALEPAPDRPLPRRPALPPAPEPDTDEDRVPDALDACPEDPDDDFRFGDGCPEPSDIDGDGILNKADACPDTPEDEDGLADGDGCPEDDADEDGFADAADRCPEEPGVHSENPEREGCPRFIRKLEMEVELMKQVEFESGRSTILPVSYPVLDEVVKLLKVSPDITHLDIEGHTDNVGAPAVNQALSRARARAVRDYLVQRGGLDPKRLSSNGFGASRPIAPNDTEEGRAKNRRVELRFVKGLSEGR